MIINGKSSSSGNTYEIFFKVAKDYHITKNICKEVLRKYRPIRMKKAEDQLNYSYTDSMISFSICSKELAKEIYNQLKKNKYFSTEIYSKSIAIDGISINQYLINSQLTHSSAFKKQFLKNLALEVYEKTGRLAKVKDNMITITTKDPYEIEKIVDEISQGGRVAMRLPGAIKMYNNKNENVKVGKILFSNYHGRPLFDKCINKGKHIFMLINNEILYELRMMVRLNEVKQSVLYLECDGVIYNTFVINEKNLTRSEILLASFDDEASAQHFMKKLKNPLPQFRFCYTKIGKKTESLNFWSCLFLLSVSLFLFLTRRRRKTIFFTVSGILFSLVIFSPKVGDTHIKILFLAILLSLFTCVNTKKFNIFIYNISFSVLCFVLRHFFMRELICNIFLSSTAQLLIYQSLSAFIYRLFNS